MWTEIGAMVIGGIVTELGRIGIRSWRGRRQDLDQWYEQSISLASHGKGICDSARTRSQLNYGQISEEAERISIRIKKHINPHPSSADEEAVKLLSQLEIIFSKLSAAAEASGENTTQESLDEILRMSQRESQANDNIDMSKAFEDSKEYSPLMKELFSQTDLDTSTLGPKIREKLDNANSIEELAQAVGSDLSASSDLVEQKIENEVVDDAWDANLSRGIRVYLQIASNLSQDVINHLSKVSGKTIASG